MATMDLTCREVTDTLLAYVDGELEAGERIRLDRHLAGCTDCAAYLKGYLATVEAAKHADAGWSGSPPEAPPRLVRAILASRRRAKS